MASTPFSIDRWLVALGLGGVVQRGSLHLDDAARVDHHAALRADLTILVEPRSSEALGALVVAWGDRPALAVWQVATPHQRVVFGPASRLGDHVDADAWIVGHALVDRGAGWEARVLAGRRVLVTRPQEQSDGLVRDLTELGADVVAIPMVRITPPADPGPLHGALGDLARYGWVAFTSANGVARTFEVLASLGRDARSFGGVRIVAIGPATAARLTDFGVRADVVPAEYRGERVAEAILADIDTQGVARDAARVLVPRAEVAREALPLLLRDGGVRVDVVSAYRNEGASPEGARELARLVEARALDVATFTSPSTFEHAVEVVGVEALRGIELAAIGPITADAIRARGLEPSVVARDYTTAGLVHALVESVQARRD